MSQDRNRRGGKAKGNRRPNKRGGAKKPAAVSQDPNRPFWTSPTDATALERGIGLVRPSQDPTALVRSLGSPPHSSTIMAVACSMPEITASGSMPRSKR